MNDKEIKSKISALDISIELLKLEKCKIENICPHNDIKYIDFIPFMVKSFPARKCEICGKLIEITVNNICYSL